MFWASVALVIISYVPVANNIQIQFIFDDESLLNKAVWWNDMVQKIVIILALELQN